MDQTQLRQIEPLTKVTFHMSAAAGESLPVTATHSIITGIGSAGLAPFEHLLLGKQAGDSFAETVAVAAIPDFFGQLGISPAGIPASAETVTLQVRIEEIARPDGRETIQAMAAQAEGCGGGCDCGCGGH